MNDLLGVLVFMVSALSYHDMTDIESQTVWADGSTAPSQPAPSRPHLNSLQ